MEGSNFKQTWNYSIFVAYTMMTRQLTTMQSQAEQQIEANNETIQESFDSTFEQPSQTLTTEKAGRFTTVDIFEAKVGSET